jgi:enoyl-CoA hydratase
MSDEVLSERRGRVLLITLNRPDARNAVNSAVSAQLAAALEELDGDDDLGVGVLAGNGKGFSAGMDLKAFVQGDRPHVEGRGFAGITRKAAEKPLIAAIEGFAVAGGLEIALSCDLIVAAKDARLGIAEVKRGLVAAAGALFRLPQRIPYTAAMELALTGEFIDGQRAYELGLINRATEPGQALDTALELANTIAQNAPLALIASKKIVSQAGAWDEATAWQHSDEIAGPVMTSEDAKEGATAFAEKRPPAWKGR